MSEEELIVDAAVARQFLHTGGVSYLECTVDTYCVVVSMTVERNIPVPSVVGVSLFVYHSYQEMVQVKQRKATTSISN